MHILFDFQADRLYDFGIFRDLAFQVGGRLLGGRADRVHSHASETFPHVYGAIPPAAVVAVTPLDR